MSNYDFDELACALGYSVLCQCGSSSSAPAPKKSAPAPKKADDMDDMFGDDDDMFGDDEELNDDLENVEEAKATEARRARMQKAADLQAAAKAKKEAAEGKKNKEKPVEKSLIVLEVKPWEADVDLKMVWNKILEFKIEGLTWGVSYKLEPVAFGIMKLVMTCSIIDSKVLQDDITDAIETLEDWVQSVQVVSMNKI
jgi:translation elongation factor EF-1beta